jgi:hypothetical protein
MEPTPSRPQARPRGLEAAATATRRGRSLSLHALQVVEYALSAPAPRRERTWLHRLKTAVDALAAAVDRQIQDDDDSVGLLSEIALSEPAHLDAVLDLRDEQRALRVAISSALELLEDDAERAIHPTEIRDRLAKVALQYRQHQTREAELIHTALDIDLTEPLEPLRGLIDRPE